MNKVDSHIKRMMLQYPTLFKTRRDCLAHLFLVNGNGYDWDENGCLVESYSTYDRASDKMRYDDLDKDPNDEIPKVPGLETFYAFRSIMKEKERMDREFREKHIDILCQMDENIGGFSYEKLDNFDPEWSKFRNAPYGKIDSDWLKAMEEVVKTIKYSFNMIWHLHYDSPIRGEKKPEPSMFSRMPEQWQTVYIKVLEIEEKLEAQSGSKAKANALWNKMKDKVLKDEKTS